MKNNLREELEEICHSLYTTGLNDGKNNIKYLPKPVEFRTNQLLSLFNSYADSLIGGDEGRNMSEFVTEPSKWSELAGRNDLRAEQREKLRGWVK